MMRRRSDVPAAATLGLFVAWAVHDAEELLTMPGWIGRNRSRLRARLPGIPERVWDRLDVSAAHARCSIGLMAGFIGAAAVAGARTGGRHGYYQAVLAGFGWHSVIHLGQAAVVGGYTPGVLTSPTVVAPFSAWAWRRLRRAGLVRNGGALSVWGVAAVPVAVGAVHAATAILTRARSGGSGR